MTIPVTTRSGKGSPLTPGEMDANLVNLARDSTQAQQGQSRFATPAEAAAVAVTDATLSPGTFMSAFTPALNAAFPPAFAAALPPALDTALPPAFNDYLADYAAAGNIVNAEAGYYKLLNGPYIQWGNVTRQSNSTINLSFYKPMTTVYFFTACDCNNSNVSGYIVRPISITGYGFTLRADTFSVGANPITQTYWVVIGL